MNDELEEKTERITAMLLREGLDAVLLNSQHNFAWLTGGGSNGVDSSRENGVASLLVTREGERFVLASVIEIDRILQEEVSEDDFHPVDYSWQGEKAEIGLIAEKAEFVLETGAKLGTDVHISAADPVIENKIAPCRYQLTAAEAGRFRMLGRDAGSAMRSVIEKLNPGESEIEIAEKLRVELASENMTSVVTLVAADERIERFRHPVPSEKRWNKLLLLVTCAKRGGLIVSLSRIVCIGDVPEELQRKTEATAYVNACLAAATRPDVSGARLYSVAADAYAKQGFGIEINKHHQGGAAGYRTRDWVAHPKSPEIVQQNQAFAWNPSITGTKVEETTIVTDTGVEVITASPDFPSIAIDIDGRTYFSPGILSL